MPICFEWGVFCKQTIADQYTGKISLIEVIPDGLFARCNLEDIDSIPIGSTFPIVAGSFSAVAKFSRNPDFEDFSQDELSIDIGVSISFSGETRSSSPVELVIKEGSSSDLFVVNIPNLSIFTGLTESRFSKEIVSIYYKYLDIDIAKIELPVDIAFFGIKDN